MFNTDQSEYSQVLANVTKYLTLILKESNGLKVYAQYEADLDWQSLHNSQLSIEREILLSESVRKTLADEKRLIFDNFKSIISRKYEDLNAKLIYDKIHEELSLKDEEAIGMNKTSEEFSEHSPVKQKSHISSNEQNRMPHSFGKAIYSVRDKLRLTQAIWFLPNLTKNQIKKLLKNKEVGNFILNEKCDSSTKLNRSFNNERKLSNCNLILYVMVANLKVNEYLIKFNKSSQCYYVQNGKHLQYKSIYNLLEHYIVESPISDKVKLQLPRSITDAYSLQQLVYLSSLKQDFWRENIRQIEPNSSSSTTTSSLSKDYSKEFKQKNTQKSLNFLQNIIQKQNSPSSISISSLNSQVSQTNWNIRSFSSVQSPIVPLLTLSQSHVKNDTINYEKDLIKSNTSIIHSDCSKTSSQVTTGRKSKRSQAESQTNPHSETSFGSSSVSNSKGNYQPLIGDNRSNLNRILFRKRFRSKSLNQLHNLKEEEVSKKNFIKKKKAIKRERYFYDPRYNKIPGSKSNSKNSYIHSYSYSSNSSTFSQSSNESNFSTNSNTFFSRFQWPHKFISNKLKSQKSQKSSLDDLKLSRSLKNNLKESGNFKKPAQFGVFFLNLFQNKSVKELKAPPDSENSSWSETDKTSVSNNYISNKKEEKNIDFDSQSLNSCATYTFNLADTIPIEPPPLPLTSPPQLETDKDYFDNDMVNLFKKNQAKSNEKDEDLDKGQPSPVTIRKFLNNIGSPKLSNNKYSKKNLKKDSENANQNIEKPLSPNKPVLIESKIEDNAYQSVSITPSHDKASKYIESSRVSNEYSEPFDLLMLNKAINIPESESNLQDKSSEPLSLTRIENNTRTSTNKLEITKSPKSESCLDDDSAYSSSYISQTLSSNSPKNQLENKGSLLNHQQSLTHNQPHLQTQNDPNFDTDDTLNTFDLCAMNSSSSASSSPLSPYFERPSPLQQRKSKNKANLLPILSEYESVSDALVNMKLEQTVVTSNLSQSTGEFCNLNEESAESVKINLSDFNTLNNRCAKIIDLFDDKRLNSSSNSDSPTSGKQTDLRHYNSMPRRSSIDKAKQLEKIISLSNQNSTLKKKLSNFEYINEGQGYSYGSLSQRRGNDSQEKPTNTLFLERTLTFKNLICFSSLLSSTNESPRNFAKIRSFVFQLSQNTHDLFGKSINEFINCVNTSKELNPNILMSNTRQFMNGIKNYLIKNNVSDFNQIIEQERLSLETAECLNIDSILEDCLQSILLRPLKAKIYYLLVDWLIKDSSLVQISRNIKKINSLDESRCSSYLALQKFEHKPNLKTLKTVRLYYNRMQCEYAPLVKLKYILYIINELLLSNKDFSGAINDLGNLNVVSFLPVVIYTMCKSGMSAIQIEIDYVWSLAYRTLLTNECIYYLTLMSSACFVLKSLESNKKSGYKLTDLLSRNNSILNEHIKKKYVRSQITPLYSYMDSGLIDIYLPDDKYETIKVKTIPVKPNSKCKDVNALIAAKFKIFNSSEFALFFLENGIENRLKDDDQPLELKINKIKNGSRIKFIYKKKNDNLLWSKTIGN